MKNVIVTGANGFIGKTLVNALLEKGYHVVALDIRFDEVLANDDRVTCVSVLNKEVSELAKEIPAEDYMCFFHLAWAGTSGPARADYAVQLNNVKLACDYIKLCAEVGCKRVVYASSINEMETYEYLQSDDIEPAGGYIYGTGKLAAHLMGETVAKCRVYPCHYHEYLRRWRKICPDDLHFYQQAGAQGTLLFHCRLSDLRLYLYH